MRLIDADEALRLFGEEYEETKELIHNGETHLDNLAEGFTEAAHIIKYILPTVDAVPVVRCKDCKYFDSDDNWLDKWEYCKKNCIDVSEDWFCKSGMREDKENEK